MLEREFRERVQDYHELVEQARGKQGANGTPLPPRRPPDFKHTDGISWAVVYDVGHLAMPTRIDLGRACGLIIVTGAQHDHAYGWDS